MRRMRAIRGFRGAALALCASGLAACASGPRELALLVRPRIGDTYRYEAETYGTVMDLDHATAGDKHSTRREIAVRVRDVAPGKFVTLEARIERTTLTVKGALPLYFDSNDPSTHEAAQRHPDGALARVMNGRPIFVTVMREGGVLKADSEEILREARARRGAGETWEQRVRAEIAALAKLVAWQHTTLTAVRPGARWTDRSVSFGPITLECEAVRTFEGTEGMNGRRCARFETRVERPPPIRDLLIGGWEAWSTSWVDLETGILVEHRFRYAVVCGFRGGETADADYRGRVTLLEGKFPVTED